MKHETFIRVEGTGAPLLLIHGVGLDHTMWDLVASSLAGHRRIVRYDMMGHGRTPDLPGDRSIEDFVSELLHVVQSQDLDQPEVVGISLGGMVALATSIRNQGRFGKLVLLNTVFDRSANQIEELKERLAITETDGMNAVAKMAVDRWFKPAWQAEHPERVLAIRERLQSTDLSAYLKAYNLFIEGDPLMPEGAQRIQEPVLAMTGEFDLGSTVEMSTALAGAVQNGQVRILNKLHHLPPIEAPDLFATALINFLETGATQ